MTMNPPFYLQSWAVSPEAQVKRAGVFSYILTGLGLIQRHHSSVPFLDGEVHALTSHSI